MIQRNYNVGKIFYVVFSMISDKGIRIKNIYYMLTYAFQALKQGNYENIASEDFEHIEDLFTAILAKGIAQQLKHGLYREYIPKHENLSTIRGKIDINGTIINKLQRKQKISCEYDELSENNTFNQILKSTSLILMKQPSVKKEHKANLKKVLLFFEGVDTINLSTIKWNLLSYQRNNQNYKMLLNICYFVIEGLLLSTTKGEHKVASFLNDEYMHRLFERFVLEYYKLHYRKLQVKSSQIEWDIDDDMIEYLPKMETDITLKYKEKTLIIDTKYYKKSMQTYYDKNTIHSNNLYQIFTYVKNLDVNNDGSVSGLLLYAKTEEETTPDYNYIMSGNKVSVKTLDLNREFLEISKKLDEFIEIYFGMGLRTINTIEI